MEPDFRDNPYEAPQEECGRCERCERAAWFIARLIWYSVLCGIAGLFFAAWLDYQRPMLSAVNRLVFFELLVLGGGFFGVTFAILTSQVRQR